MVKNLPVMQERLVSSLGREEPLEKPKPTSIKSVMPYSHLILCRPLLLLPPIPPNAIFCQSSGLLLVGVSNLWSGC